MITDYKIRRSHGHSCVRDRQVIPKIREFNFPKRRNHVSLQEKQRNAMGETPQLSNLMDTSL